MFNFKTLPINKIKKNCIKIIDPEHSANFFVRNIWFFMAFLIPFSLMVLKLILANVAPFGNRYIVIYDALHQYLPFFADFQSNLQEGGSPLWSWNSGLGADYLPLIAYYLASPINLLTIVVPPEYLREFIAIATCVKIGFAGLFFAQFLRIVFNKRDISVTVFGLMYALSAYFMGYYWNIMWLDGAALLPLVVAGAISLLRNGKFKLYVISLALLILFNCYIGLFVCIFIFLISICYLATEYKNFQTLLLSLGKMALFSIIAIAITAILTVPTMLHLSNATAFRHEFPTAYETNIVDSNNIIGTIKAFFVVVSNLVPFNKPNDFNGLPNIYCGLIALAFGLLYFTCSRIRTREKIASGSLLLLLIFSFIIRNLDFIWNGFRFPNGLPYRYSFLFSFLLLFVAYRAFINIKYIKPIGFALAGLPLLAIVVMAFRSYSSTIAIVSASIIVMIFIGIWIYRVKALPTQVFAAVLFIICLLESGANTYVGAKLMTTGEAKLPIGNTDAAKIVDYIDNTESQNYDIYRCEVSKTTTFNDPTLMGINGVSIFASTANSNISSLLGPFGVSAWTNANQYTYQENSPFTNMMLNIKYLISPNGVQLDKTHTEAVTQIGDAKLLKNNYYLPQGFIIDKALLDFDFNNASANAFENQNEIFRLITGLSGDLYTNIEIDSYEYLKDDGFQVNNVDKNIYEFTSSGAKESPFVEYNYTAPFDGTAYVYFNYKTNQQYNVDLSVNDDQVNSTKMYRPYIMPIGNVKAGDKLTVYSELAGKNSGTITINCCMLNEDLFLQGYERLSQSTFNCTKSSDTEICGTIDVKEGGLFYTSCAYDPGWKAYVDGNEVEITPVNGALIAFELDAGFHEIELKFYPKGLTAGIIITITAVLAFAILIYISSKKKKELLS